jgi:hypothetical protein
MLWLQAIVPCIFRSVSNPNPLQRPSLSLTLTRTRQFLVQACEHHARIKYSTPVRNVTDTQQALNTRCIHARDTGVDAVTSGLKGAYSGIDALKLGGYVPGPYQTVKALSKE